jgi:hypothetical protein
MQYSIIAYLGFHNQQRSWYQDIIKFDVYWWLQVGIRPYQSTSELVGPSFCFASVEGLS